MSSVLLKTVIRSESKPADSSLCLDPSVYAKNQSIRPVSRRLMNSPNRLGEDGSILAVADQRNRWTPSNLPSGEQPVVE